MIRDMENIPSFVWWMIWWMMGLIVAYRGTIDLWHQLVACFKNQHDDETPHHVRFSCPLVTVHILPEDEEYRRECRHYFRKICWKVRFDAIAKQAAAEGLRRLAMDVAVVAPPSWEEQAQQAAQQARAEFEELQRTALFLKGLAQLEELRRAAPLSLDQEQPPSHGDGSSGFLCQEEEEEEDVPEDPVISLPPAVPKTKPASHPQKPRRSRRLLGLPPLYDGEQPNASSTRRSRRVRGLPPLYQGLV